jgi:TetR/AcrR family transcriptional repressor of mexJK operon
VLQVAATLFTSQDYDGVHMEAVAEAAEIAKPTLYRYFPTKEALFLAALEQTLGRLVTEVAHLSQGPSRAETRLRRAIALIYDQIGCLAPALRAIEGHGVGPSDHSRKTLRKSMLALSGELTAILNEGSQKDEFGVVDTELAALAIIGAVRMAATVGRSERPAKGLADLLLNGLLQRSDTGRGSKPADRELAYGATS